MITLNCVGCGTTLRMDDGFAGGVCRCSACGAMLSVPATDSSSASGSVDQSSGSAVKSGASRPRHATTSHPTRDTARTILRRSPGWLVLPPLALLAGGGLALAWLTRPEGAGVDARSVVVTKPDSAFAAPMFGPVDLSGATHVVFLLDQADVSASAWPELVRITLASVWNLGPGREVRVGVWHAQEGAPITPAGVSSVGERLDQARHLLSGVRVGGTTELLPALDAAIERRPSDIVLVSGRAPQMDSDQAGEVLARLGGAGIRIHAMALGSAPPGDGWRMLAQQTGGVEGRLDSIGIRLGQ